MQKLYKTLSPNPSEKEVHQWIRHATRERLADLEDYNSQIADTVDTDGLPNGGYAAGRYYGGNLSIPASTVALSADTLYGHPFYIGASDTFTGIVMSVDTTGTANNARVGIYNVANGVPSSLVVDGGELDVSGTGVKEATISQAITPGLYAISIVVDGTVTVVSTSVGATEHIYTLGMPDTTTTNLRIWTGSHTYAALPSSFPSASYAVSPRTYMWVRTS